MNPDQEPRSSTQLDLVQETKLLLKTPVEALIAQGEELGFNPVDFIQLLLIHTNSPKVSDLALISNSQPDLNQMIADLQSYLPDNSYIVTDPTPQTVRMATQASFAALSLFYQKPEIRLSPKSSQNWATDCLLKRLEKGDLDSDEQMLILNGKMESLIKQRMLQYPEPGMFPTAIEARIEIELASQLTPNISSGNS